MDQIRINGVTIAYREKGVGDAVLLLHAFPLHSGMWEAQLGDLSTSMRVIAVDARGFGASGFAGHRAGFSDRNFNCNGLTRTNADNGYDGRGYGKCDHNSS